jgi:hypothetical protein
MLRSIWCNSRNIHLLLLHLLVPLFTWLMMHGHTYLKNFVHFYKATRLVGGSLDSLPLNNQTRSQDLVNETNLVHVLFLVYFVNFIYNLYIFRTSPGPSSGGITLFMRHLILVILYSWLSVMRGGIPSCIRDSQLYTWYLLFCGARVGVVVKALRYKPAGRGFHSRCCHWNFSVT